MRSVMTTEGFLEDCCVIVINSTDAWPLAGESREIFIEVAEVGQTVSWAQVCLLLPLPLYLFSFVPVNFKLVISVKVKFKSLYRRDNVPSWPSALNAFLCTAAAKATENIDSNCGRYVFCAVLCICILFFVVNVFY